jgi:adenylate cyclase
MNDKYSTVVETILLTFDYVGSTRISKELDFEKTNYFYQVPLNIFTEVITDHGGIPWKYIGDQIIALYYISDLFTIKSDAALKCAERLIKVSQQIIAPKLKNQGVDEFSIRVSIDAGKLVPIVIKKNNEIIPDLVGVTINRLSKICSQADANQILVGENYYKLIYSELQDKFIKSTKCVKDFANYNLWEYNLPAPPEG